MAVRHEDNEKEFKQTNLETLERQACEVTTSKGVPRQAEVAQGVPGRLSHRIILTFRHYNGGKSSAKRTGRLYPNRNPWYSLSEAESNSGHMVLSGVPRTPPGIDPGTVRPVTQRLNHYATTDPKKRQIRSMVKAKVKQARYRPGMAQRVPES